METLCHDSDCKTTYIRSRQGQHLQILNPLLPSEKLKSMDFPLLSFSPLKPILLANDSRKSFVELNFPAPTVEYLWLCIARPTVLSSILPSFETTRPKVA